MALDPKEVIKEALRPRAQADAAGLQLISSGRFGFDAEKEIEATAQAVVEALGIEFDAQRLSWGSKPYAYQSYRLKGLEGKESV